MGLFRQLEVGRSQRCQKGGHAPGIDTLMEESNDIFWVVHLITSRTASTIPFKRMSPANDGREPSSTATYFENAYEKLKNRFSPSRRARTPIPVGLLHPPNLVGPQRLLSDRPSTKVLSTQRILFIRALLKSPDSEDPK